MCITVGPTRPSNDQTISIVIDKSERRDGSAEWIAVAEHAERLPLCPIPDAKEFC
jgi:hypothetical protein